MLNFAALKRSLWVKISLHVIESVQVSCAGVAGGEDALDDGACDEIAGALEESPIRDELTGLLAVLFVGLPGFAAEPAILAPALLCPEDASFA